jgi:CRISPR-associated endonuclease/helicase Cas3
MIETASIQRFVDAAFQLRGRTLPLDHGYALFSALCGVLPELHAARRWGVHPVLGRRVGPGVLALGERSWLKLRLPVEDLARALRLAGSALDVSGHQVGVGVPTVFPLVPTWALKARFVTIKGFQEAEPFREAAVRQLAALLDATSGAALSLGPRRVMRIGDRTVVGFAVALDGLSADESLAVQERGLGGRRRMGGGVFVPLPREREE